MRLVLLIEENKKLYLKKKILLIEHYLSQDKFLSKNNIDYIENNP